MIAGLVASGFLLVVLLLEESAYDRLNRSNNPLRPNGYYADKVYSLSGKMGHETIGRKRFSQALLDIWLVFRQPQFLLLCKYSSIIVVPEETDILSSPLPRYYVHVECRTQRNFDLLPRASSL